jgi:peptidyl-prolyl cis-trans isomerase SurA
MQRTLVLFLMAVIFSIGSTAGAEVFNGIAAVVNDEVITLRELDREYAPVLKEQEKRGTVTPDAAARLKRDLLTAMVDRKLIKQKIKELKIVITLEEVLQSIEDIKRQNKMTQEALSAALLAQGITFDQYKAQMKEELERIRLMSQEVRAKIQVSEREIREYYDANGALFSEEPTYRARHIFLKINKQASNEEIKRVMAKAADVMAEARSTTDFAALARKYSDDPGAATGGGDLGSFKKGDMLPEIESAVITMQPGEVSELVTTPAGFHIIKLEEKTAGKLKPFETVKASINDTLYRKKSEERFKQWAEELRKGAAVDIKL